MSPVYNVSLRLFAESGEEVVERLIAANLGTDEGVYGISSVPEMVEIPPDLQVPPPTAPEALAKPTAGPPTKPK